MIKSEEDYELEAMARRQKHENKRKAMWSNHIAWMNTERGRAISDEKTRSARASARKSRRWQIADAIEMAATGELKFTYAYITYIYNVKAAFPKGMTKAQVRNLARIFLSHIMYQYHAVFVGGRPRNMRFLYEDSIVNMGGNIPAHEIITHDPEALQNRHLRSIWLQHYPRDTPKYGRHDVLDGIYRTTPLHPSSKLVGYTQAIQTALRLHGDWDVIRDYEGMVIYRWRPL